MANIIVLDIDLLHHIESQQQFLKDAATTLFEIEDSFKRWTSLRPKRVKYTPQIKAILGVR